MAEGEASPFGPVFTNFAEIDRKLKAYHKSCDRLAVLVGKAEEGKTADWTLMRASLKEAGIDEAAINEVRAIWQDLEADKTWEGVYLSSAEALEGAVSWTRREKENTKRALEDEWAGDERVRQEAEAVYRGVYSRYINGEAGTAELRAAAAGAFGTGAAAQKKLLSDTAGVTMANFQGVTLDGSAFGDEYVTLAQDYLGMTSRAYAARYSAEWAARSSEWDAQLSDIQRKRQLYREAAQLIQERGLADWDAGMRNVLTAYNSWRNNFMSEYERVSGNWDAAYLAGLLEKEEWANRATEAAADASKAALFAATGTETASRIWDTYIPGGMLTGDAVAQSRGLLAETLGGAGIAGLGSAFRAVSGGAATVASEVRRGLSAAAVLDTGRVQVKAAALARDAREDMAGRELKRIAEMVRLAAEEAVQGLKDSLAEANRNFDKNMDSTFKLRGQWTRNGGSYRKAVIVNSTLFDAAVTETKTVEAYRYYTYPVELKTDISPERIEKLDTYSVRALIAAVQNDVNGISETVFGTPGENENITGRTVWVDILKSGQVQTGTRKATSTDTRGNTVVTEVPVYETRDVSAGRAKQTAGAGTFGKHIGYQSVSRGDANPDMGMGKYFQGEPYGELGRLMEYFEYYQAVEGVGVAKMGMAPWDKSLWDDRDSWFKAPTLRGLTDLAVGVAITVASGGFGAVATAGFGTLAGNAAAGLIDDAVFGMLDIAGGYKGWDEAGKEFGMKVAGAAVNLGSQELFKGVDSAVGKALVAAGTSYAGSVTAGFIGSVNWDKLGTADWINGERMKESAFGAGTIASALSAGAMAGTGAAASAKLASLGETGTAIGKFYGGAIKLGTAAAGKAVEYGTHAAYSLAQGGTLMDAYDNMGGITLNIANLGSIIDMVGSGIARNNTTAQSVLGSIAEKLGGTGLLEINIGSEGVTGRIGSGGIDVGGAVYDLAKRGIDRAALEEKLHTAEGQTAYGLYVHEDWTMENTAMRVANGKDGLLFVEQGGLGSGTRYGQTVRNGSGGRSITIADMGYADNVAVLGHEAYRDGMTPDGDYLETRQAVRAHTELADRMRNAGYSFNSEGVIGLDLAVYDYARSVGNMGIMDTYADMVYRSDGDYFDIEETLKGKISYVIGKTFQDEGIERGLLGGNLTFGGSIAELLGVFQMYIGPKLNNTPDAASNNAERVFDRWNEIETDGSNETIKEVATLDDLIKLFNSMADGGTLKPVKFDGNNMDEYLKRTTAVLSDGTEITYRRSSSASSGNLPAIDISWPKDKSYPWGEDNFKVHITYPKKGGKK